MIFDRGVPDVLGYLRLIGLSIPAHVERAAQMFRYNRRVFIAPPWRDIFQIDAERKQSFEEAQATYEAMIETYSGLGYELIQLPLDLRSGARELFAGGYRECLLTSHGLMCSIMETSLLFGANRNFMQSG